MDVQQALRSRVYPRVYGGTARRAGIRRGVRGLSPRVRGNHLRMLCIRRLLWSIPACTGEPRTGSPCWGQTVVYPRVYGGTVRRIEPGREGTGLSPRVRGNPGRDSV